MNKIENFFFILQFRFKYKKMLPLIRRLNNLPVKKYIYYISFLSRKINNIPEKKKIKGVINCEEVINKIKVRLFCEKCNGTGYFVTVDSISICSHCYGTGFNFIKTQ